jgi:hypothetical protein
MLPIAEPTKRPIHTNFLVIAFGIRDHRDTEPLCLCDKGIYLRY